MTPTLPRVPRQPCRPKAHARGKECAACAAWEQGRVLLVNGRTMNKTEWVLAFEVRRQEEQG